MNHDLLISRLGEKLGLPLVFDQSNQCMLLLDDRLMVSISADDQDWLFDCMLTKVEPESEHRILKEAVRFNHILTRTGSGHIYFEENGRALLYQVRVENPQDGDEIFDQLTDVVNQYEKIHSDFH